VKPVAFLVALEGIDGSGKGTQAQLLKQRLTESGVTASLISFPRYDSTLFGGAIGDFLNGRFGALDAVCRRPVRVSRFSLR
jgi:dTMP kinase